MQRWLLRGVFLLIIVGLAGAGWRYATGTPATQAGGTLTVAEALGGNPTAGFKRVTTPRPFVFPADHGPHPGYQTEWWYYTGNLSSADGRAWGYQLTFFRTALTPNPQVRTSAWGADTLYMAHFALTDVAGNQFYAADRYSRDGAGLAGAQGEPYRVWLETWSASGPDNAMRLVAAQGDVAIDLTLRNTKPAALQGDRGVSQKSAEPGNASYYYSLTRMATEGTFTIKGKPVAVTGASWMDREWSTSALGQDVLGWDWFALHLNDGRDLMFYQLRRRDGSSDPYSAGTLIAADGSTQRLARDDVQLETLARWRSPGSGADYPAGWRMRIPSLGLDLTIRPYVANQELPLTVVYWEGAAAITGTSNGAAVQGNGYVELTGYGEQRQQTAVESR